jgi:hypothetical protein
MRNKLEEARMDLTTILLDNGYRIACEITKDSGVYREVRILVCRFNRVTDITGLVCSALGKKRGGQDRKGNFPLKGPKEPEFSPEAYVAEQISKTLFDAPSHIQWYHI